MIHDLGKSDSIISQYVSEIRDNEVQQDRLRFRRNLERIGALLAHEVSKTLEWTDARVTTPLGTAKVRKLKSQPVVCSVLRAGLVMHDGILGIFDHADSGFVSAYRKHDESGGFHIHLGYITCPSVERRTLILADTMLATGQSVVVALAELLNQGTPSAVHVLTTIAATEGLSLVERSFPTAHIWAATIDEELDERAYIVPGLGDAGDLAYGAKLQA